VAAELDHLDILHLGDLLVLEKTRLVHPLVLVVVHVGHHRRPAAALRRLGRRWPLALDSEGHRPGPAAAGSVRVVAEDAALGLVVRRGVGRVGLVPLPLRRDLAGLHRRPARRLDDGVEVPERDEVRE